MTDIIIVINIAPGVRLRIPAVLESKHYSTDEIIRAGELMAKKLGGTYSHWEDAQ